MYNLINISAQNFTSFESVSYVLENKCYIVKGENKDNRGQQSNGSGKTSLLEIIAITLLGQSLTNRDLKQCVNRYGDNNYFITSITLSNQKDTVTINRRVYNNTRSQELAITINGKPIKDIPTKAGVENGVDLRRGNEWILNDLLGISKEDLLNYYLISDKHYKGFLSSGNQDKINVISRFSNATKIDRVIEDLKKQAKVLDAQIGIFQAENTNYQGQIDGLNYKISDGAKQKFEQDKEKQKQQLLPRIAKLEQQLEDLSKQGEKLTQSQFECEEFYGRLNEKQIEEAKQQKQEIAGLIDDIEQLISKTQNYLRGKIVCPQCHHEFVVDSEQSIEQLEQQLSTSQNDLGSLQQERDELRDKLSGQEMLIQFDNDIERLSNQLESIDKTYTSLQDSLSAIESQQFISPDVEQQISFINRNIEDNNDKIKRVEGEEQQIQTWIERFERFKYFLINKPIAIICHQTNQVLRQVDCEYSISIEGFKKLKSGELRAELTPIVHIRGVEDVSYDCFSLGERTRLDLACDLAIQNMINATSKGGLNFYMNDEKISGLDSQGIENVAKSFDSLGKTILFVSHSGSDLNHCNVITVCKQNKKSILI